jgi:formyl-CoA transferase
MTHGERSEPIAPRRVNRTGAGGSPSDLFPCAPGGPNDYVFIHVNTQHFWDALCIAIDQPEMAEDERFATPALRLKNLDELQEIVSSWTRQRTKWEAMEHLGRCGLPAGAVFDTLDLLEHPHLVERGMVSEIDHPTRGKWKMLAPPFHMTKSSVAMTAAPLLGEHTDDVLFEELGIERSELDRLAATGVTARAHAMAAD